jgi:ABC-2 type transport system ATP-binding protein
VGAPATLGGRAGAATTVRWFEGGQARTVQTDEPTRTVLELASRFDGGEIPELAVLRPSLEDIYLRMIGGDEGTQA